MSNPVSNEQRLRDLSQRHTAAMAARDVSEIEQVYAPDCLIWHNTDRIVLNVADHIASYLRNTSAIARIDYADIRVTTFEGGYVQQHVITARLHDGRSFEIACCLIARARDGRIVQLEEYLDSAAFGTAGLKTEH